MNEPLDQDALEYGSMMPEQPKAVLCSALVSLPGQPLCRHYTGAALEHLRGDYSCKCLAGVPCFVKQDCAAKPGQQGRIPENVWKCKEFPIVGNRAPSELPERNVTGMYD